LWCAAQGSRLLLAQCFKVTPMKNPMMQQMMQEHRMMMEMMK
jgi:hypothetical protein